MAKERVLSKEILTILLDKIEKLNHEKAFLSEQLKTANEQIQNFKLKYSALRKEGNALKRYNSRLVFNSFISELTDVPKNDANSQVRMKRIYRDFSNGSMRHLWCNLLPEQKPATSCIEISNQNVKAEEDDSHSVVD